jgi:hypothetical protein
MTGELELFLRQVGPYRHRHDFWWWDLNTATWVCDCGERRTLVEKWRL